MAKYSRRLIQTTHSAMLGITMARVTIRTTTITLRWVFGLILAFSLAMPVMAKNSACDTSTEATLTTCTGAQQSAYDLKIYSQSNSDFFIDGFDDANALNKYREYLDKIIEGYTPNDEEFQELYLAVRKLRDSGKHYYRDYFGMVTFFVGDVYPDFGSTLWEESDWEEYFEEFASDFHDTWTRGDWRNAYNWALRQSYPCEIDTALCDTRDPIDGSHVNPVRITDRVVELLGGGTATKDSLYIENGYRTTGINFGDFYYYQDGGLYDYQAFGLWAQDSYWVFGKKGFGKTKTPFTWRMPPNSVLCSLPAVATILSQQLAPGKGLPSASTNFSLPLERASVVPKSSSTWMQVRSTLTLPELLF